jgi:WD40 repeat protein
MTWLLTDFRAWVVGKQLRTVATADAPETWSWSWLAFSPDGKRFLAYGWDLQQSSVIIWDAKTWKQIFERQSGPPQLRCFAFMPEGSELAVGMQDGGIELWDMQSLGTAQE